MTVSAGRFAEVPERSVIKVSMVDFELWLKIFPSPVGLKNRQGLWQSYCIPQQFLNHFQRP